MAGMPFKRTSQLLNLGASVAMTDGSTTNEKHSLPLSTLDREIFVVTDYQIELPNFGLDANPNGSINAQVMINKTKTDLTNLSDSNCVARRFHMTDQNGGGAIVEDYAFPSQSTSGGAADFISVIATPDFQMVARLTSTTGGLSGTAHARIQGFRAVASADLYAALVTEELNQG
jgi:hypothetical protein